MPISSQPKRAAEASPRAISSARFSSCATSAPVRQRLNAQPQSELVDGYAQLIFEIAKTRSVVLHSLDHTLGADVVDEIIDAAEQTAKEHVAQVLKSNETPS